MRASRALLSLKRTLSSRSNTLPRVSTACQRFLDRRFFSEEKTKEEDEALTKVGVKIKEYIKIDPNKLEDQLDRSRFTREIEIKMPDMGEGGGKVIEWFKKEGDVVQRNDILCDIETKDFTFGFEIDDEEPAILGRILVEAPSDYIEDNAVLCTLLHEDLEPKKEEVKEK